MDLLLLKYKSLLTSDKPKKTVTYGIHDLKKIDFIFLKS